VHLSLILFQEGHEEAQEELPKKVKSFFSTAVQTWDAEFYVKADNNINLDLGIAQCLIWLFAHTRRIFNFYSLKLIFIVVCCVFLCRGIN
jgi:hypothetical protein